MTKKELFQNILRKKSFLCVGLDPDKDKMPGYLAEKGPEGVFEFNKAVIDSTARFAVAYKPNIAFYETMGAEGIKVFADTCRYIRENHPDQFIIADAKRGDIGNTARMYARSFFENTACDAVTVAPYMGRDSVEPFLGFPGKWAVVLALTSNKGSEDFQMIKDQNGNRIFETVVEKTRQWGTPENIMFVVGATRGELIKAVRDKAPDNFFLVPGVGAQGGSLEDVCEYGMNEEVGLIVNSSRGIIHASDGNDFADTAGIKARMMQEQMAQIIRNM